MVEAGRIAGAEAVYAEVPGGSHITAKQAFGGERQQFAVASAAKSEAIAEDFAFETDGLRPGFYSKGDQRIGSTPLNHLRQAMANAPIPSRVKPKELGSGVGDCDPTTAWNVGSVSTFHVSVRAPPLVATPETPVLKSPNDVGPKLDVIV